MKKDTDKVRFIKMMYAANAIEADQVIEKLKQNGIVAIRQGGIKDIYMGGSAMGEEIQVAEADLERAAAILEEFEPIRVTAPAGKSGGEEPKMPKIGRLAAGIAFGVFLLMILVAIVSSFF